MTITSSTAAPVGGPKIDEHGRWFQWVSLRVEQMWGESSQWDAVATFRCTRCHAMIGPAHRQPHIDWHRSIGDAGD